MKNFYNYIFYRSFDLMNSIGSFEVPWYSMHFIVFNEILVYMHFYYQLNLNKAENPIIVYSFIPILVFLYIFNSRQFLSKSKYLKIVANYENEPRSSKIAGRVIFLSTFLILLICM